jgi:hypothetical protein
LVAVYHALALMPVRIADAYCVEVYPCNVFIELPEAIITVYSMISEVVVIY